MEGKKKRGEEREGGREGRRVRLRSGVRGKKSKGAFGGVWRGVEVQNRESRTV